MAAAAAVRRYAGALFELAGDEGRVAEVRQALGEFSALLEGNAELRDILLTPLHPVAQRRAVLDGLCAQAGTDPILRHFYSFLIDQRRLVEFDGIRAEYERRANEQAGVIQAQVRSASPLSDAQKERLRSALSSRTGRQVELEVDVDPSLLGGVVASVGDVVFDGSLQTQLDQLRSSLSRD